MASKSVSKNNVKKYPNCGAVLKFALAADLRIRGNSGLDLLEGLFQESPKTDETTLPLDVHVCPACGCVQLVAGTEIKKSLLTLAAQRNSI